MTEPMSDDRGIGYAGDDYAGMTATSQEIDRLARLVTGGPAGDSQFSLGAIRKANKSADEDTHMIYPCRIPETLLRESQLAEIAGGTWDQARAMVGMLACQIAQTGWAGKRRATGAEREWAADIDAGSRCAQYLRWTAACTSKTRVCHGCNSDPCRCLA